MVNQLHSKESHKVTVVPAVMNSCCLQILLDDIFTTEDLNRLSVVLLNDFTSLRGLEELDRQSVRRLELNIELV